MHSSAYRAVRLVSLMLTGLVATRATAISIGGVVDIGAAGDNSAIKINYGSYSSAPSAAPVATYAVAYVVPDANWATTGAVDVVFQIFNPGGLNSGSAPFTKMGIGFNLASTAAAAQQFTSTTSAALTSVTVPTVGTLTASGAVFSSAGEFPTGGSIPSSGTWNYLARTTQIDAPTSPATGGGDIISWIITPNAGKKIYVSDFYNTPNADGLYSIFHLQGVNNASSAIGVLPQDMTYLVPEPSTWAGIVGVGAVVFWQAGSEIRRRRSAASK
ncbi:MAG TPA: PEP-CTERM sorting domain-containing protein [Candidatus Limnocylindria bacterium]|nr:PEP-CTERM sorting domain-containing protein [Candidatus Limnocylindria bacterium]